MAGSEIWSTTNCALGARSAPTFSTIEEAHASLIGRLSSSKPHRILYVADARDLEQRAEHLQQVLAVVLDYVGAIVTDTDHVAPGGSIDRKYLLGLISDVAGNVAGSISNAADDLAAGYGQRECIAYLLGFLWTRFRSLTPGPPPFSSVNSTPAASKARRTAKSLAAVIDVSSAVSSARRDGRRAPLASRTRAGSVPILS